MTTAPSLSSAPKFTQGSIMRHVVVMTATGSIGLMAIFIVDFLNLFYIALLGEQELAAAIGYAGTVLFFTVSLCIGITMTRKRQAMSCVRPLAPNSVRIGPSSGSTITVRASVIAVMNKSEEVASRLASSRCRAPSARETSAVPAMVTPMHSDTVKNNTVPA